MFKKISLLLLVSLVYINPTFAASSATGDPSALFPTTATRIDPAVLAGSTVTHYRDAEGLKVQLLVPATGTLPAFKIHSIRPTDWDNLNSLHADPAVMRWTGDGKTRTGEQMQKNRYEPWAKRLENLPWVGYAVYLADSDDLVGMVGLAFSSEPAHLLFWGLEFEKYQKQGWGQHIADQILFKLVPELETAFPFTPGVPVAGVMAYTAASDSHAHIQKMLSRYCDPSSVVYDPAADIGLPERQQRFSYRIKIEDLRDGRVYPAAPATIPGAAAAAIA